MGKMRENCKTSRESKTVTICVLKSCGRLINSEHNYVILFVIKQLLRIELLENQRLNTLHNIFTQVVFSVYSTEFKIGFRSV